MRSNGGRTNRHWTHLSGSTSTLVVFRRTYLLVYIPLNCLWQKATAKRHLVIAKILSGQRGHMTRCELGNKEDLGHCRRCQRQLTVRGNVLLSAALRYLVVCLSISCMFYAFARPVSMKTRGGYWTICRHLWSKLIFNQVSWSAVCEC